MTSIYLTKINDERSEIEIPLMGTLFTTIRNINGSKFNTEKKRWNIPNSSINELVEKLKPYATIENKTADEPPNKRQKLIETRLKLRNDECNGYIKLIDFSTDVFNYLKSIPNRYYDKNTKEWVFDIDNMDEVKNALNKLKVIIE